jgi:integrase
MTHHKPRRLPDWFTNAGYTMPAKHPLTPHASGYVKSINGRTVWVCGKIPPAAAEARYAERYKELNERHPPTGKPRERAAVLTITRLAQLYDDWLIGRMETGKPKKLSRRTYHDAATVLQGFLDTPVAGGRLGDLPVTVLLGDAGPGHFTAYAATIAGDSPYTVNRHFAYVHAMFAWAGPGKKGMRYIDRMPHFGPNFQKAPAADMRKARAEMDKPWEPAEFQRVLAQARKRENLAAECFLWLGATCGFNAADIAALPVAAVDLDAAVIDFARTKTGEFRRCPLVPPLVKAMRAYRKELADLKLASRVSGETGLYFVTQWGNAYCRVKDSTDDAGNPITVPINTISQLVGKLMDDADVRREGRGHSGLRTTFRSLADELKDQRAIDVIMGHKSGKMSEISAHYVPAHKIPIDRLRAVVDHVYAKLSAKPRPGRPRKS